MSCQNSPNTCSDCPTLNDLNGGCGLGRRVSRIHCGLKERTRLPITYPCPEPIPSMHCGQRREEGGASDVSLLLGSPQDRPLTAQAEASQRLSLPLIDAPSRQ